MCSCFGYALVRGGQRVLMIDADPATDGLSLFLLGPKGKEHVRSFSAANTFVGILQEFQKSSSVSFEPHPIHRRTDDDHGVSYDAIISGKGLYGDEAELTAQLAVPDIDQLTFRAGVKNLFDILRISGEFSYVLVDTRGGFAFESTDVCALADSFIVVTEPDYTSFYQDRNLVARINRAAIEMESPSVLRAMIVNKGTDVIHRDDRPYLDNIEVSFRNELTKEFGIPFHATHGVPVDIEALLAYKTQKIPYINAPGSLFSFATLSAFSDILQIVTSRWTVEQVDKWNELVNKVTAAVKEKSAREQQQEEDRLKREAELVELRASVRERDAKIASLDRELSQQNQLYEREFQRTTVLLERSLSPTPPFPSAPVPFSEPKEIPQNEARNEGAKGFFYWLSKNWKWIVPSVLFVVVLFLLLTISRTNRKNNSQIETLSPAPSSASLSSVPTAMPSSNANTEAPTPTSDNPAASSPKQAPAALGRAARNAAPKATPNGNQNIADLNRKAATGDSNAMTDLGNAYYDNQDFKQAVVWYSRASDSGNPSAMNSLGWMYKEGLAVPKDYPQAAAWFRKAADAGSMEGAANLGRMYQGGLGVGKDCNQALALLKRAADAGIANAMAGIGWSYENGCGVAKDHNEATRWYLKAAQLGDPEAKAALKPRSGSAQ